MRNRLDVLTEAERAEVHESTLKILAEIGFRVTSDKALHLLHRAGAQIEKSSSRARIPREMVDGAIASVRKDLTLFSRDGRHDCRLSDRSAPALSTDGTGFQMQDFGTYEVRRSSSKDLFRLAVLSDYLEEIDIFWPMVIAGDVPEYEHTIKEFAISLLGTGKHIQHEASGEYGAKTEISLAAEAVGGMEELRKKPIFSGVQCPVSPLLMEKESIEAAIEFSKFGIPVVGMSITIAGVTAPTTMAGSLAISNAETLGALVVSQAASEGSPFIYGISSAPADRESGNFLAGCPELALLSAAGAQMARSYGLPSLVAGMITDSHCPSQQSGFEKMQTGLIPALSNPSIISGVGGLDTDNTASLEQLVIDCDIWGAIKRAVGGMIVNPEKLSYDLIKRIGTNPNYSEDMDTVKNLRGEIWQPRLPMRLTRESWVAAGSKAVEAYAHEIVTNVLTTHHPAALEKDREKRLMEVYQEFQRKARAF